MTHIYLIYYLRKFKKGAKKKSEIQDEKYLSLNIRIQTIVTTMFVAGVALAVLGWNIKTQIVSDVIDSVTAEAQIHLDKIGKGATEISDKIQDQVSTYDTLQRHIGKLRKSQIESMKMLTDFNSELQNKSKDIETLLNIYLVTDVPVKADPMKDANEKMRFYYKNLKPINAKKLPLFKSAPIVLIHPASGGVDISIWKNTNKYFELQHPMYVTKTDIKLTFWIVERPN